MIEKELLRQQMKKLLSGISKPHYEHLTWQIANRLFTDSDWVNAKTVGITISQPPEVDTYQIIRKAWEEGKQIVIPKCFPKTREMAFRTLHSFNQLESVYSGLYEPIIDETTEIPVSLIDVMIVPGLAFDRSGFRLGFGGGYYDRYLKQFSGITLSLAFTPQIVTNLPVEHHDVPVSKIITNETTIHTS